MSTAQIGRVALTINAGADRHVQLLPAGEFRATDGRPTNLSSWRIDRAVASHVIERAANRANDIVIDFEHQTLNSEKNGQPAPAAGWFKALEWRDGIGLFAADVRWTPRATAMIRAGEYRYISPVFSYDKDGTVSAILGAGLTNTPALDGMMAVALRTDAEHVSGAEVLSQTEIDVCTRLGISTDAYLKTKSEHIVPARSPNTRSALSPTQLDVCRRMGIDPSDFLQTLKENTQ